MFARVSRQTFFKLMLSLLLVLFTLEYSYRAMTRGTSHVPVRAPRSKEVGLKSDRAGFSGGFNFSADSRLVLGSSIPGAARLGNLLFSYSSLACLATKLNASVFLREEHRLVLSRLFDLDPMKLALGGECKKEDMREERPSAYDESIVTKLSEATRNTGESEEQSCRGFTVGPYLQSWRYFGGYDREVRSEFRFQDWLLKRAERVRRGILRKLFCPNGTEGSTGRSRVKEGGGGEGEHQGGADCLESKVTWIGVHVRRGDMAMESSRAMGYLPATSEYLNRAIRFMEDKFEGERVVFLVASDDEASWCRTNLRSKRPLVYLEDVKTSGDPVESPEEATSRKLYGHLFFDVASDLSLLSSSDHLVMTVGSFGWWAGFLTAGTVVYFKDYPRPGTLIAGGFSAGDYYPPDWIGMS